MDSKGRTLRAMPPLRARAQNLALAASLALLVHTAFAGAIVAASTQGQRYIMAESMAVDVAADAAPHPARLKS